MKVFAILIALYASAATASALKSSSHQISGLLPRHNVRALKARASNGTTPKKCRKKTSSHKTSSTTAKPKATSTSQSTTVNTKGTVRVSDPSYCGGTGASATSEKTTGPNGSENFLNCGVNSNSGWNPPVITSEQVISKNLEDVINGDVFSPCKQYLSFFNHWGGVYNIPPIMLASFALQESSCNAYPQGGDGNGLMQITSDKCGGAPNGDCSDPYFNIGAGAQYFKSVVDSHNGNLVQSVGEYNGWNVGMTVSAAKEEPGGCVTQRNLDYLHQFFNGWMQGVDASNMGIYFNLANC